MRDYTIEELEQKKNLGYREWNAMLNILDKDNKINFDADKRAAREYFLQHVNKNTVFFHTLSEKLDYLIENNYYEKEVIEKYDPEFVKSLFKHVYSFKYRFTTFVGAYTFYENYALKTFDGQRFLERYEDRICMNALYLGNGDEKLAKDIATEMIKGVYQPATPTFLNAGKKQRGEMVSCFLLNCSDSMDSIGRMINSCLQLSKRGGGVGIGLSNLREAGAPIKNIEGISSGVVPVMKILDDVFVYANQLGSRQGAGAVYINMCHPDFAAALDTKRENADQLIRIKALSVGVIVPDIAFELAKRNADLYQFSPYDVQKYYGKPFTDFSVTEMYDTWVEDGRIHKKKISARKAFQMIAELQFESGYPYLMFEDNANRANNIAGRVKMSNLCSEIMEIQEDSVMNEDNTYEHVGRDISCNLASINIANIMRPDVDFSKAIETSIRSLTNVSLLSDLNCVPSIQNGNEKSHAVGLGAMNLHGYLASNEVYYESEEAQDFTRLYFYTVMYETIKASNLIAKERGEVFYEFEKSKYASGEFFDQWINSDEDFSPINDKVASLISNSTMRIPTKEDWVALKESVMKYGMFNAYLQAVAPCGRIGYIQSATSSIQPLVSAIEIRKTGDSGRMYYPAYGANNDNLKYYKDAYNIGYQAMIDLYAQASRFVDQGISTTLFFKDDNNITTRVLNKAYIYAWSKGLKSLYYTRIRQRSLSGTEVQGNASDFCEACQL